MTSLYIEPSLRLEERQLPLPYSSRRSKFFAVSNSTRQGNISRILVDNLQNCILQTSDVYLNYTVQADLVSTGANSATPVTDKGLFLEKDVVLGDNAAQLLIQKLEILSNGVSILSCDNYGEIQTMLHVANNGSEQRGLMQVLGGGSRTLGVNDNGETGDAIKKNEAQPHLSGTTIRSSYGPMTDTSLTTTTGTTPRISFSIPILGMLSSSLKNIPLTFLDSALEVQITWSSSPQKVFISKEPVADFQITSASTMTFDDVSLDCRLNFYEESSMDVIKKVNNVNGNEPIVYNGIQYKSSLATISKDQQATTQRIETLVPNSRFRCLNSILYGGYPQPDGANSYLPCLPTSSQQYRVGNTLYPNTPITRMADVVLQTQECFSSCDISLSKTLMTNKQSTFNCRQTDPVIINDYLNHRAVCGVNLQTFTEGGLSGIDSTNLTISSLQSITGAVAIAQSNSVYCSVITVAYQLDSKTGRIAVSF
jgi:hypothetical protein